jgi:hypothetical protein
VVSRCVNIELWVVSKEEEVVMRWFDRWWVIVVRRLECGVE